jgi:hypothetical protein
VSDAASHARSWEQRIETALDPGRYVSERHCFTFVSDLERVVADVTGLVASDPRLTATSYQTFVAGCTETADEVDDSSGEFGMFVVSLVGGRVSARQAAAARPDRTASRLLAWVDDDPYGFCHRLVHDVAEVFDRPGRAALTAQVQARFDAYVHVAEQVGLTAADCHTVTTMLAARGEIEQALSWVEAGLAPDTGTTSGSFAQFELAELKPRLPASSPTRGTASEPPITDRRPPATSGEPGPNTGTRPGVGDLEPAGPSRTDQRSGLRRRPRDPCRPPIRGRSAEDLPVGRLAPLRHLRTPSAAGRKAPPSEDLHHLRPAQPPPQPRGDLTGEQFDRSLRPPSGAPATSWAGRPAGPSPGRTSGRQRPRWQTGR